MARPQLRIYYGPQEESVQEESVVTHRAIAAASPDRVTVPLCDVFPLLADAVNNQRTWLRDFADDEVTMSTDLYEVLLISTIAGRPRDAGANPWYQTLDATRRRRVFHALPGRGNREEQNSWQVTTAFRPQMVWVRNFVERPLENPVARPPDDLIQTIRDYADKLLRDGTTRGDLKILSRALRELRYAFKVFSPYRSKRKVTVFGSARTLPDAPAYQEAMELGRRMAELDWMVITGAASGIMEAGHRGAGRDHAMGLNIMLPFEQSANSVIAGDTKLVHMKYFFTRKLMFVKECDAVVCLPGGFGTLDEALEVLTLLQTGKHDMMPVVLLDAPGGVYWQSLHSFFQNQLLATGMISPEDLHLYRVVCSVDDAVNELTRFYRVYHSMRYVKQRLVLRLQHPLSAEQLEQINSQFADIVSDGRFEQSGPLAAERDEPNLAHLTRLAFHFNRRSLGRLRQLINYVNQP